MKNTKKGKRNLTAVLTAVAFVLIVAFSIFLIALNIKRGQEAKVEHVLGIDVSAYQGDIDWKEIEKQDIKFAFIKATEGVDYVDEKFKENWENIDHTNIKKGAYFYFIFGDDGNEMADHFINIVPNDRKMLPPVIDVELTGNENPVPEKKTVIENVKKVIEKFKDHYHQDPIIYTNNHTYDTYFKGEFKDIKFWIANINVSEPKISDHEWIFWQYTWRNILNGINGSTTFVDGNVFNGNLEEFYETFDKGWF